MKKKIKKTDKPKKSTFEDRLNQDSGMIITKGSGKEIKVEKVIFGQGQSDQPEG